MKKTVYRYGLFSAAIIVASGIIGYFIWGKKESSSTFRQQEIFGYLSIIISLFVFAGIKYYRDKQNAGRLTFTQGIKMGLLITLFPSILFGLYSLLFMYVLNPEFNEMYYNYTREQLKISVPQSQIEAKALELQKQKEMFDNPFLQFILMFLTVFVIGIIITVISSLVLRRNGEKG